MLLTCKRTSCHDKHTLIGRLLTLSFIDTTYCLQGEGIAERTPRTIACFMVIVGRTRIEEVRICRVHPPSIRSIVEKALQVFPVDGSGHRTKSIIDLHARRIIHTRRPDMRQATLRPCLEREQKTLRIQFSELLGLRTETRPDGNHEMSMFLMYVLDELLTISKIFRKEVHRIPKIVGAPILPILHDTIEGHLQLTILVDNAFRLCSTLIAFL